MTISTDKTKQKSDKLYEKPMSQPTKPKKIQKKLKIISHAQPLNVDWVCLVRDIMSSKQN